MAESREEVQVALRARVAAATTTTGTVESLGRSPRSDRRTIHIVGPHRLQNTLLATYLGREVDVPCQVHEAVPPVSEDAGLTPDESLLLFDCLGAGAGEWRRHPCLASRGQQTILALFNLGIDFEDVGQAVRSGVRGFFFEDDQPGLFVRGIRLIFAGELWVSRHRLEACLRGSDQVSAPEPRAYGRLTRRESEILQLMAQGATNESIADRACISTHTVKTHLYNIYRKLEVANRLQAARWATKNL